MRITPQYVGQKLVEAGVMTQEQVNLCRRIVLDCAVNSIPQLYIQLDVTDDVMDKIAPILPQLLPPAGGDS
jgi:hypothetical protein